MFALFFSLISAATEVDPCVAYNSSCLLCMEHKDECFYCFGKTENENRCVRNVALNETTCEHVTRQTDRQCIETLGGDAIQTNRYIIGSVVIGVAIIVDLIVRLCTKPKVHDEYAHL
ncbi:hypothetical protein TVAG_417850 [Trichomonas vaginalis G3]|uniref:Uncharacterized protein n=1 Tax=Trichomonas vaginalis (strain ATCC PRA-98 / G3) TaxID=412133 RepID=A2EDA5_TRIV3|nr:hypothetical protein TVAGG3_0876150 [Trichomonas vaginalis G3]EAY09363.1 hypothetical protein TVAG_417850 [Trichomonas vaginalis G3]KAI5501701.1 hypothetical protein TVAGG3_0876150 [Trichomonas vaginalis G3]|eukprot:XP_001321586.1 hypothetical protein [Trichomonas vaginalis G3]